jgi:heme/copper-type cytochrome/quinol oxidase subunit 3
VSRPVINVAPLPDFGFGHRALVWWATLGVIAIEGAMFALMIANYLYLKGRNPQWPPGVHSPALLYGTLNTAVLLASLVPNALAKKASEKFDLRRTQLWMAVCIAFAVAFNIVRVFEFRALNVWWDTNAYGSVVWMLLGLHTTHLVTDLLDSLVLAVLMFTGPIEQKRFSDVSENAFYWYFVVLAWLPIYALIYFAPRVA